MEVLCYYFQSINCNNSHCHRNERNLINLLTRESSICTSRVPNPLQFGLRPRSRPPPLMAPPKHCFEKEPLIAVYNW